MRFRYAFQKIVDLKTNEKMQAEWILSQAVGQLTREEACLSDLRSRKEELRQHVCEAAARRATISELLLMQQYMDHIDQQIDLKNKDVLAARRNVSERQEQLSEKMLQEKVWSKAREKAFEKFSARVRKREQDELDEMAAIRHRHLT